MTPSAYPEHEKLKLVQEKSQACGEFLEWLRGTKDYTLCQPHAHGSGCRTSSRYGDESLSICRLHAGEYVPATVSVSRLLAEFFGIDQRKLDEEKELMLDRQRELIARKG